MPAEEQTNHLAVGGFADDLQRAPQARAVLCAAAKWRTVRARLAERQIAPQHHDSGLCECVRYGDQERRTAVGSRAMGEYERVLLRSSRVMQETAHRRLPRRLVDEAFHRTHSAYTVMIMELSFELENHRARVPKRSRLK